jgi:hypothetical protein
VALELALSAQIEAASAVSWNELDQRFDCFAPFLAQHMKRIGLGSPQPELSERMAYRTVMPNRASEGNLGVATSQ